MTGENFFSPRRRGVPKWFYDFFFSLRKSQGAGLFGQQILCFFFSLFRRGEQELARWTKPSQTRGVYIYMKTRIRSATFPVGLLLLLLFKLLSTVSVSFSPSLPSLFYFSVFFLLGNVVTSRNRFSSSPVQRTELHHNKILAMTGHTTLSLSSILLLLRAL